MGKTFIRIDDRLIHGQIVVAWCGTLNIQEIIVIDNTTASNPMLKQIMTMGVPKAYKTEIVTLESSKELLEKEVTHNRLVIMRSPIDLPTIIPHIKDLDTLYLGNIQKNKDSIYNLSSGGGGVLFFSQKEVDILEDLYQKGINIVLQMVPQSSKRTWEQAKKVFNNNK
ncbi:MAG TPA: PTS sugar transporter subunit IIB [Haloplasmataceae bacterium]